MLDDLHHFAGVWGDAGLNFKSLEFHFYRFISLSIIKFEILEYSIVFIFPDHILNNMLQKDNKTKRPPQNHNYHFS